jgi:hypothetical protein
VEFEVDLRGTEGSEGNDMIAVLLTLTSARADQCAWVPEATAERAVTYLAPGQPWAAYCEPCGDAKPTLNMVERKAEIRRTSAPDLWEVVIDGQPVDLAYVFVVRRPTDTKLGNLAFLAECETTGVSKTIPRPK